MISLNKIIDEFVKEINKINKQMQGVQKLNYSQEYVLKKAANQQKIAYL